MRETPLGKCELIYCDVCMDSGFDSESKLKADGWTIRQFGPKKPRLILCAECEAKHVAGAKPAVATT